MKILATMVLATLAVAPLAAQQTTVVHKTVVVHHDEHPSMVGHRRKVCTTRWDHRHHAIRHCVWQG